MSCNATEIVNEALGLAKVGDLSGAEKCLEPIMDTVVGAQMCGLLVLMAGKSPDDFARGHRVLADFPDPSADLEVVRSLYEIFDLHAANEVDAGVRRLIDAEAAGAVGGFEFLIYLVPALARASEPRVDEWLGPIEKISGTLPHFAMSLMACVDLCVRNHRQQSDQSPLVGLIKSVMTSGAGPLKQCPKMLEPVLSMKREFDKPCLLGVHLRLPKAHGNWVSKTLRSHPKIKAMPWGGGVEGFGNAKDHDVGWIAYDQGRISAICSADTIADISDLPGQVDDCFSPIGGTPSEMLFGEWRIEPSTRMIEGYSMNEDLGHAMYIIEYNESYNNQGFARIQREVILFAPELDKELAGNAAKVLPDGRSGDEVTLTESGRDVAAERAKEREVWLNALATACANAGNSKAEKIVNGVDAANEQSVERLGSSLYYALANHRNSMEADPEGWFEEDDEGHREFVADFVKLAGKELKLSKLESETDDNDVETVRCEINGERFEATADNQFHMIDMGFVSKLMQHCKPLGKGCYINLVTSDGLALAYVPKEIGEILIERSSVIEG